MLRVLDDVAATNTDSANLLDETRALVAGGYHELLWLADGVRNEGLRMLERARLRSLFMT